MTLPETCMLAISFGFVLGVCAGMFVYLLG